MIRLNGKDSFVIYQLPKDNQSFFCKGTWKSISENENFENDTFVVNLFNDTTFKLDGAINKLESEPEITSAKELFLESTKKEDYINSVQKTINKCKKGEIEKCIISRVLKKEHKVLNYYLIFKELTLKYPHGLKYILNHPEYGLWIGVSPETLINGNKIDGFYTHSLAGSKSINNKSEWTSKEVEEHKYVTDYIRKMIKSNGELIAESEPYVKSAGNINHLNIDFNFKLKSTLLKFINKLHPTPAIAGVPLNKSLALINKYENYSRDFYCGFIGTINDKSCELFVNLRCGRITKKEIQLFVGGGITKKSNPKDEFLETEIKSQTILSVIKKM
jgi:isochorismate synthase